MILLAVVAGLLSAQTPAAPDVDVAAIQRIARQIQREIRTLPDYGVFDDIRFGIKGSTVILRGLASRPTLKNAAERVAKKVEGVENVVNEIELLPLSPQDDEIRLRTYVAVYGHPALQRYASSRGRVWISSTNRSFGITQDPPLGYHAIHIIVKNGNITLEGTVDNPGDSAIAEIRANGVPGAFSVTNRLVVLNEKKVTPK